jgi:hypothetical protein
MTDLGDPASAKMLRLPTWTSPKVISCQGCVIIVTLEGARAALAREVDGGARARTAWRSSQVASLAGRS